MEVMEKVGLVLLGALFSVVGYFIKRKVERRGVIDALDRHKKLLEINRHMNDQGLSIDDMRTLEVALTGKAEAIAKHSLDFERDAKPLTEKRSGEFLSQAELNLRADANLKISRAKLNLVYQELTFKLDDFEITVLRESQDVWEAYSVKQAEAESARYRGGSIYPLIYLSELDSLTVERAARLQTSLDELRRQRG